MTFKQCRTLIVITAALAVFSGCIKSESPQELGDVNKLDLMGFEKLEESATFYIKGDAKVTEVEKVIFRDGTAKDIKGLKYRFEVCLSEKASSRILQKFSFDITSSVGELPAFKVTEETDETGCLHWTENFTFDIGKPNPDPVMMLRKITAVEGSTKQGEISFIFRIFPWASELKSQAYPVFYYVKGDERNEYRGQVQNLFNPEYNPLDRLRYSNEEQTNIHISQIDYNLTAIPFSYLNNTSRNNLIQNAEGLNRGVIIENTNYPSDERIRAEGLGALTSTSNYVMLPERDNPRITTLLEQNPDVDSLPYRINSPLSRKAYDGLKVDLVLKIKLAQAFMAVNGMHSRAIVAGTFKVLPYIYAVDFNDKGERVLLNPGVEPVIAKIDDRSGEIYATFSGTLPFAPTSGRVQLALEISSMNNNVAKYKTINSLYVVGDYDSLIGKVSNLWRAPEDYDNVDNKYESPRNFDFIDYAKNSSGYEEALRNSHLKTADPFDYSLAGVRFKTIEAGETATRRTVIFNVQTCLKTLNGQNRIESGREFEVISRHFNKTSSEKEDTLADKEEREPIFEQGSYEDIALFNDENDGDKVKTDANGCLNFIDKINHKYYQTERLFRRKYFIRAKADDQNFTKKLVLYLNPWDEKFGTLGTDARAVSETFLKELQDRKKIVPRFFIKDFRYETLRFRYEIDKNMNLVVKKTVLFRTHPWVMRYSNVLQGINSIFPIRDGIYLLKMAYQKDYLDPSAAGSRDEYINIRSRSQMQRSDTGEYSTQYGYTNDPLLTVTDANGNVIRSDRQTEKAEGNANASGDTLDGSQKVFPPYDPSRRTSLSIVKKLVRVNAGAIVTPIEFSIEDLRLLRIRAQLFIQIEPINQTKLQIVNMASEKIEEAIHLEKGGASAILELPKDAQRVIIQQKMDALDTLVKAIPDDLRYSKDDASELLAVFNKPEVINAFKPFTSVGELANVERMLGREQADPKYSSQSVLDAFETEKDFIENLKSGEQSLRDVTQPGPEEAAYRTEMVTRTTGPDIAQRFYDNPDDFYKRCGETWKGYDQCVADGRADKGDKFDELLCKCFDNMSKDYSEVNTTAGAELESVTEAATAIRLRSAHLSAASILREVRESNSEFFSDLTEPSALEDLLLNDFTLAQAEADVSDLNFLMDEVIKDVDIERRTFVGPLTFLGNSNGGALRPTDNLDEAYCVTDDCNSLATDPLDRYSVIKNFDYERSPYHGSIAHFSKMQVDDFINGKVLSIGDEVMNIPSYKNYKENRSKKYAVKALLSNFVEEFNLNYISLKDKKLQSFACDHHRDFDAENNANGCLVDYTKRTHKKADFLADLNKYSSDEDITSMQSENKTYKADLNFLKTIVKKDHGGPQCRDKVVPASYATFSANEYKKFCSLMTYGVFAKNYSKVVDDFITRVDKNEISYSPSGRSNITSLIGDIIGKNFDTTNIYIENAGRKTPNIKGPLDAVYQSCLEYAEAGEHNEPLSIERKYKIKETGEYYYLGGKSLNINLGQNIGISHKNDSNKLHKMDVGALTGFLPKFLKGYGYSYSRGEGISANEGLNVMQGTFLVMQNAEFDVELKKYEQCLVVRWSHGFMKENNQIFYKNSMATLAKETDIMVDGEPYMNHIINKLTEGVMICSGDEEVEPVAVRETYYYFTQHFTEGDMQDRSDIHNHPWLLSLRGIREFETFLASTLSDHEEASKDIESVNIHAEDLVGMDKLLESDWAAENLDGTTDYTGFGEKFKKNSWALRQLVKTYRQISPTFPGLYTQLNRKEYQVEQWPWRGSVPGEKFGNDEGINCYLDPVEPVGEEAE